MTPTEALAERLTDCSADERYELVRHLDDPLLVEAAVQHSDQMVRYGAARNDVAASSGVLAELAGDDDWAVRLLVAENFATPPDTLLALARTEVNPEVLRALSCSDRLTVRAAVAENTMTPGDVVTKLASGPPTVRILAAAHPSASETVLDEAVTDPSEAVRAAAASNLYLTDEQVGQLSNDSSEHVRAALEAVHGTLAERWVTDQAAAIAGSVKDVDRWLGAIERAAGEKWAGIREGLHAADERQLSNDRVTLGGVITHVLAEFDTGAEVILAKATGYVQARSEAEEREVDQTPTDVLVRSQEPVWNQAVEVEEAFDRSTAPERLSELARSRDERVRVAAARNPATPPAVHDDLLNDDSEQVRRAADWTQVLRAAEPRAASM